jgi:hypothetical protein
MEHKYTSLQLISYLYHECDLFTKLEIEFAMEDDSTLHEDYLAMNEVKKSLPKVTFQPSKKSIDNILAYSA